MNKNRIALVAPVFICIALAISLIVTTVNSNEIIQNQKSQIEDMSSENAVLNARIDAANEEIADLKNKLADAESKIENLTNQVKILTAAIAEKQRQVDNLTAIINMSKSSELETLVFQVCEKGEGYEWGRLPDVDYTYNQILELNNGKFEVLLLPEYMGNDNWNATFEWMKANFVNNEPMMLSILEAGLGDAPILMLQLDQIALAVEALNVKAFRISEMVSYYCDHPELTFPAGWVTAVLNLARSRGLWVEWNEWKVNEDVFQRVQNYTKGFEDIVTVCFATNSGDAQPAEGFMLMDEMFPNWGGSVQAWWWNTKTGEDVMNMPPALLVEHALLARNIGAKVIQLEPYWYFFDNGEINENLKLLMTMLTGTTIQHLPLYEEITAIKNRLTITITEPNFTNPVRECVFYELREEDSEDSFQTTVNYWVFQHGQGEHGDVEAYVEIYNVENSTDLFTVEVTRNSWYELTVSYDGAPVVVFPKVTNDTLSEGYITFKVIPKTLSIGIFCYTFYDPNDPESWDSKIVDKPLLGQYDSSNSTVISTHLQQLEDLGVDFVILSWWGFQSDFGIFRDNAIQKILATAQQDNSSLKFAIMVEPYQNETAYDYPAIYDYIYDDIATPYSSVYYCHGVNKPLICFFNDENLTANGTVPRDERFHVILVGTEPYVQWTYTNLPNQTRNPNARQISVSPRYDDTRIPGRNSTLQVDPNLTEGFYDKQWQTASGLVEEGKIDTITITSWNEYPERTAIEPHTDATAENRDPWFLYNKTRDWISEARAP